MQFNTEFPHQVTNFPVECLKIKDADDFSMAMIDLCYKGVCRDVIYDNHGDNHLQCL